MKNLYKQMFEEERYKQAYEEIKSKPGNMIPGTDNQTIENISKKWIKETIKSLKDCSFKFKPSKRIEIPKKNGKIRKIGIPSPKDKIIQQVMKNLLEGLYY